jgi:arginyl-tRNA synthetase
MVYSCDVFCSLPVFDFQKKLVAISEQCLSVFGEPLPTIHFEFSMEEGRGDLTTSVCMQLAKKVKKAPMELATELAQALRTDASVEKAEAVHPGYVNVTMKAPILFASLDLVIDACEPKARNGERPIVMDYSAPNIAKPLGIHHILSTVIGQSIANLYRHQGYEVVAVNHIGDWGTQFGKLAVAYKKWGDKPVAEHSLDDLLALYVRFHEEVESQPDLEDEARQTFSKIEKGDPELKSFWSEVVTITMRSIEEMYERLHITFDTTQGESFYEDKMQPILDEGVKKGVFTEGKEEALIVQFPEESKMPPAIALKGDGSTIYLTRDLATAKYRIDTWHPQSMLYVVDIAQQLYFTQLFATLEQLQWKLPHLEHVFFGRMRFQDASMSTRKGNIMRLEHVLDEAVKRAQDLIRERGEKIQTDDPEALAEMMGVGAVVYGVLSQNRTLNMVFDWDKMLSFEGNSAPYLQYTHARAMSVLRKADGGVGKNTKIAALTSHERGLVKQLLHFPFVIETARREHLPHKLTNYLYEVCQCFNSFYNSDDILQAPTTERLPRLRLTSLTATVLKTGAELLTLRVPERM